MTDFINRQQAIDAVMDLIETGIEWRSGVSRKISLLNAVYCALEDIPSAQPTVDAVPVAEDTVKKDAYYRGEIIRCEDCKCYDGYYCHNKHWGDGHGYYTPPIKKADGFCDWAERK